MVRNKCVYRKGNKARCGVYVRKATEHPKPLCHTTCDIYLTKRANLFLNINIDILLLLRFNRPLERDAFQENQN